MSDFDDIYRVRFDASDALKDIGLMLNDINELDKRIGAFQSSASKVGPQIKASLDGAKETFLKMEGAVNGALKGLRDLDAFTPTRLIKTVDNLSTAIAGLNAQVRELKTLSRGGSGGGLTDIGKESERIKRGIEAQKELNRSLSRSGQIEEIANASTSPAARSAVDAIRASYRQGLDLKQKSVYQLLEGFPEFARLNTTEDASGGLTQRAVLDAALAKFSGSAKSIRAAMSKLIKEVGSDFPLLMNRLGLEIGGGAGRGGGGEASLPVDQLRALGAQRLQGLFRGANLAPSALANILPVAQAQQAGSQAGAQTGDDLNKAQEAAATAYEKALKRVRARQDRANIERRARGELGIESQVEVDERLLEQQRRQRMERNFRRRGLQYSDVLEQERFGEQRRALRQRAREELGVGGGGVFGFSNVEALNDSILRHIFFIGQALVVYKALELATQFVNKLVQSYVQLDAAARQYANTVNTTVSASREALLSQQLQGAAVGVGFQQTSQSGILQQQLGLSPEDMERARKLFVAYGGDYRNIVQEIAQTQNRAADAGVNYVDVLSFIATAQERVGTNARDSAGALEFYFDALQEAVVLAPQLGVGVEKLGLALANITFRGELGSASSAGTYVANLINLIQKESVKKQLKLQFGIDQPTIAGTVKEISSLLDTYTKTGQRDQAERLVRLVYGGTLVGARSITQAQTILRQLQETFADTSSLSGFDQKYENSLGSMDNRLKVLTASWDSFVNAIANSDPALKFVEDLTRQVDNLSALLLLSSSALGLLSPDKVRESLDAAGRVGPGGVLGAFQQAFGENAEGESFLKRLFQFSAYGNRGQELLQAQSQDPMALLKYLFNLQSATPVTGGIPGAITGGSQYPYVGAPSTQQLLTDRLFRLPEKSSASDFAKLYAEELAKLQAIPGYQEKSSEDTVIALLDNLGNYIDRSQFTGNVDAASNAIARLQEEASKAAEAMKMFGGIQTLENGTDFGALSSTTARITSQLRQQLPQQYQEEVLAPKDTFFWDDGQLLKLTAPLIAIQLAQQEMLKLEKQKIQGLFNVPDAGRILVPFFALEQGFVPRGYGGIGGDGASVSQSRRPSAMSEVVAGRATTPRSDLFLMRNNRDDRSGAAPATNFGSTSGVGSITIPVTVVIDGDVVGRKMETRTYRRVSAAARASGVGSGSGGKWSMMK